MGIFWGLPCAERRAATAEEEEEEDLFVFNAQLGTPAGWPGVESACAEQADSDQIVTP